MDSPYPLICDPVYPTPEITLGDVFCALLLELSGQEDEDTEVIAAYRDLIPNIISPGPSWN
jgi:hypothetical protein